MKTVILVAVVAALSGCATAVVDVAASTTIYATKAVVTTTYDVATYPFRDKEEK